MPSHRVVYSLLQFAPHPPKVIEEFPAKVVGVTDGDTITVLRDREQIKIRLEGIDAPERGQAFGTKSKSELSMDFPVNSGRSFKRAMLYARSEIDVEETS